MKHETRFEEALHSQAPLAALHALALQFSVQGWRRGEVYKLFEGFVVYLRNQNAQRESDEELLMEAMDALTDWCHPGAQLKLPVYLEPDVAEIVQNHAHEKDIETDILVNQWLRNSIATMQ